ISAGVINRKLRSNVNHRNAVAAAVGDDGNRVKGLPHELIGNGNGTWLRILCGRSRAACRMRLSKQINGFDDNEVGSVGLDVATGDRVHGKTMRNGKERIRRDRDCQVAAADEGCGNRRAVQTNLCGCVKTGAVNLYADKVSSRG